MRVGIDGDELREPPRLRAVRAQRRREAARARLRDRRTRFVVDRRRPGARAAAGACRRACSSTSRERPGGGGRRGLEPAPARHSPDPRAPRGASGFDAFLFPSLHTWFPGCGAPTVVGLHDTITSDHGALVASRRRDGLLLRAQGAARGPRCRAALHRLDRVSRRPRASASGSRPSGFRSCPRRPTRSSASAPGRDTVRRARSRAGLAPDEPFFLYVGGISPHKDVETLVDAYALAHGALDPAPRLVVAGALDGDEAYVSSAASVRARIAAHGLDDRVRAARLRAGRRARRALRRVAGGGDPLARRGVRPARGRGRRGRDGRRPERPAGASGDPRRRGALLRAA